MFDKNRSSVNENNQWVVCWKALAGVQEGDRRNFVGRFLNISEVYTWILHCLGACSLMLDPFGNVCAMAEMESGSVRVHHALVVSAL